jgi:hypothetical protein
MNKWEQWWDSLPPSTKEYLKAQPVWHDSDMWQAGIFGLVIGFILGCIL